MFNTKQKATSPMVDRSLLCYKQQLFTCTHELAHAVLHPDTNTAFPKSRTLFSTDKIEIDAILTLLPES